MEKKRPKQLYLKMFRTYTAMVLCIVAALVLYFMSATRCATTRCRSFSTGRSWSG